MSCSVLSLAKLTASQGEQAHEKPENELTASVDQQRGCFWHSPDFEAGSSEALRNLHQCSGFAAARAAGEHLDDS